MNYSKSFKTYIRNLTLTCLDITGSREYNVQIQWQPKDKPETSRQATTRAEIIVNTTYLWCKLFIYPQVYYSWKNKNYLAIADTILHEACHILSEPILKLYEWDINASQRSMYEDVLERQTQRIANALMSASNDTWYLPENNKDKVDVT